MRNSLILLIMILFTISHSVFGKENSAEILVNSREMALELSYVYIKYIYGKEKAEFQKPYSITAVSYTHLDVYKRQHQHRHFP